MIFTALFIVIVSLLEQVSAIPCAGPQGSICDCIETIIRCNSQGLTDTFDGVPKNTTELDLSFNKITNIAANAFDDLMLLELLDLGRNHILNIEAHAFGDLVSLKSLDLSNNNLSSLPSELFMFNINLVKVDLSKNHLSSLSAGFFSSMINLEEIVLYNNEISFVSPEMFSSNTKLKTIQLRNNPLVCCNMTDFIEWAIKKQLKGDDIKCIELSTSIGYEEFDISNCTFPVDGQWGSWTTTSCSVTCGYGVLYRYRTCNNPSPSDGGKDCKGFDNESSICNLENCSESCQNAGKNKQKM